jgi:HEPN domain-containing protein
MGKQDGHAWVEQAQRDLKVARDNVGLGNYELVCFLSQQAAGKALKGFLLLAGRSHQPIHSVSELLKECAQLDPRFEQLRPSAGLDLYYISTRYPDAVGGGAPYHVFDKDAAEKCLSLASSSIEFVTKSIES